jgi:hypothetical protein
MTTDNKKLIDRVDSAILEFNKKIATNYANRPNHSKASLEEELYCGSAIIFGLNTFAAREYILGIPMAITAIKGFDQKLRPRGADYEHKTFGEIYGELTKYTNVFLYCAGAVNMAVGTGGIIAGAATRNIELVKESFNLLGIGLGTFGWMSADYVSKAEIEPQTNKNDIQ